MPKTIEMFVSLKVPDTTAITALQTLQKLGFKNIKDVKKSDYYKFTIEGDLAKFKDKISKVDIIVNANKHFCEFKMKDDDSIKILVKNTDDDSAGLILTLKNRLGIKEAKSIEKGTLWKLFVEGKNPKETAEKAAKELLVNENYQEYKVI